VTDRKPNAGFWVTLALFAVLVGYPLSIGPVSGILTRFGNPDWSVRAYRAFYAPILWFYESGPAIFRSVLKWYCAIWQ